MSNKSRLADLFYENETEYYGLPPFGLLDEIGEGVVNEILNMFERAPKAISSQADFLSQAQIETVNAIRSVLISHFNRGVMHGRKLWSRLFREPLSFSRITP